MTHLMGFSKIRFTMADRLSTHIVSNYSTVALVPPISTVDVWRGITYWVHSSVKSQFPKVRQTKYTAAYSCDGAISVLNHCLSWSMFVNTHLSHTRQWSNIHLDCILSNVCQEYRHTAQEMLFTTMSHSQNTWKLKEIVWPFHLASPCLTYTDLL